MGPDVLEDAWDGRDCLCALLQLQRKRRRRRQGAGRGVPARGGARCAGAGRAAGRGALLQVPPQDPGRGLPHFNANLNNLIITHLFLCWPNGPCVGYTCGT